jgi:hypothetical protein
MQIAKATPQIKKVQRFMDVLRRYAQDDDEISVHEINN